MSQKKLARLVLITIALRVQRLHIWCIDSSTDQTRTKRMKLVMTLVKILLSRTLRSLNQTSQPMAEIVALRARKESKILH